MFLKYLLSQGQTEEISNLGIQLVSRGLVFKSYINTHTHAYIQLFLILVEILNL